MQSSLAGRILYPLWSYLKHRYNNSAEKSLQGYRYICQQFAGQLAHNAATASSARSSLTAERLKDLTVNRRPCMLLASAGSEDEPRDKN